MTNELEARWRELWNRLDSPKMFEAYSELRAHYSEPHRYYHNLTHISECLDEFSANLSWIEAKPEIAAALWFHDVIYDPRAKDNEERSVEFANEAMGRAGLSIPFRKMAGALILATKTHTPTNDAEAVIVDIDLSILGRHPLRFDQYEQQIRKEYDWVSDDAFAQGRAAVLKTFLNRTFIYSTEVFRGKYEKLARENVARSLNHLIGSAN